MESGLQDLPTRPVRPAGLTVWDQELACPGYTLYCHEQGAQSVILLDMRGEPVHTWEVGLPPSYAELLPNGHLLLLGYLPDLDVPQKGQARIIMELSWDGKVLWEFRDLNVHHDFARLPNGNTLLLCREFIPKNIAKNVKGGLSGKYFNLKMVANEVSKRLKLMVTVDENNMATDNETYVRRLIRKITKFVMDGDGINIGRPIKTILKYAKYALAGIEININMVGDSFVEVTPDGDKIWEWHGYEHLDTDEDIICPLCHRMEWTHANSCQPLPNGDILTTFRQTHTVAIVDRKTGDFRWKWGKDELGHPHDPTILHNGNVLLFDNGMHVNPLPRSRVLEIDIKTNEIVWSYQGDGLLDFFSPIISGAQRLSNGNTLICEGNTGRLFEVTHSGDIVWEFFNPSYIHGNAMGKMHDPIVYNWVFRARRYPPDFPAFIDKELTPANG